MNEGQLVRRREQVKGLLSEASFVEALKVMLPKHLTPDKVMTMVIAAASRNPRILECTDGSILKAARDSSELGLDCSGTLGQGYLVPYYNGKTKRYELQFQPGYQGLINLARRSGKIRRIEARVVYKKDTFKFEYGLEQKLHHVPYLEADPGDIVCVYGIAELDDGSKQLEVMTLDQVNGIRNRSKAAKSGPWITDYSEMARKTVIRRLCKYLPMSVEMEKAIEVDNMGYDFQAATAVADEVTTGVDAVAEKLKKEVESKDVTPDPAPVEKLDKARAEMDEAAKELEEETEAEKTAKEKFGDDKPTEFVYTCNKCNAGFDEPGGTKKTLCPLCLCTDFRFTQPEGAEATA